MAPALEVGTGPNQHIRGDSCSAECLIRQAAASTLPHHIIGNHHQDIKVAVGTLITPGARTKQVDLFGVVGLLQPLDDLSKSRTRSSLFYHEPLPILVQNTNSGQEVLT